MIKNNHFKETLSWSSLECQGSTLTLTRFPLESKFTYCRKKKTKMNQNTYLIWKVKLGYAGKLILRSKRFSQKSV